MLDARPITGVTVSRRAVLLIAFHAPPVQGSSGWQRCLRFAQHLLDHGWRPILLTVKPMAYEARQQDDGQNELTGIEVHRAFALDTARHLSLGGRYPRFLALPDRWATWRFHAVPMALNLIRRYRIKAIWSTFPIATAHAIAREVAGRSGLPWIAEFRDPMWQGDYPPDPAVNSAWLRLEERVFQDATATVVTTPGARALYERRYSERLGCAAPRLIENGYDEAAFKVAEAGLAACSTRRSIEDGPLVLLHSGIVYRSERDPGQLFLAVAALKRSGRLSSSQLQIVFRACGDEAGYRRDLEALDITDIIRLEPAIPYGEALREMLMVDGLLLLQAANCNEQIPAKLYEYLRAGRPILALTDPAGDTARTLRAAECGVVVRLDSEADITRALMQFLDQVREDSWQRPDPNFVQGCSRRARTSELAELLVQVSQMASLHRAAGGP